MKCSQRRPPVGMTHCRSLYDHLVSLGSGGTLDDLRTAIDIAIIRQSIVRAKLEPRWCPTGHMVADGPLDLLRSELRNAQYQLADEETALDRAKAEKLRRKQNAASPLSISSTKTPLCCSFCISHFFFKSHCQFCTVACIFVFQFVVNAEFVFTPHALRIV